MPVDLDPRFTFDAYVVGPANRLAVAAARRVADAPGTTYNPLFIYSASGLGKTHILTAIGHQAHQVHDTEVVFETLERLMDQISTAVEAGERDVFRGRVQGAGVLLLDDVQFVAGHRQTQEELILAWDSLSSRGAQVVLTSDRPPQEIDGLDDRLLSRLSGGLIVDMSAPDYETRVAIARRKAEERGRALSADVCQAVGRIAFTNVRELQGALNRLIAVQDLEDRIVEPEEVVQLLGVAAERGRDEFGEFLSDITGTMSAVVAEADQTVADAILAWEGEGYRTRRLEGALNGTLTVGQAEELVRRYEQDVARLRKIVDEIRGLEAEAREADMPVLRDPDRVAEAESLLARVRERQKPPPAPPPGPGLEALGGDSLALRAARAVADAPGDAYNPLYVKGPDGAGKSTLLIALGNSLAEHGGTVAYLDGETFGAELIDALEHSRLDGWRARFRRSDVLLLDDLDALAKMERAQEELFHLFEELHRDGRQLVFAATAAPQDLGIPSRLRSRLEGGLVVELDRSQHPAWDAAGPSPADDADAEDTAETEDALEPEDALETEVVLDTDDAPETEIALETEVALETDDAPETEDAPEPELFFDLEEVGELNLSLEPDNAPRPEEKPEPDEVPEPEEAAEPEETAEPEEAPEPEEAAEPEEVAEPEDAPEAMEEAVAAAQAAPPAGEAPEGGEEASPASATGPTDQRWSREKVLWSWPYTADWIEESLD